MFSFILDFFSGRNIFGSRSAKWSEVRNDFIKENPLCAVCGKKRVHLLSCEVHHKIPFNIRPELELQKWNLITLCRPHHFLFGHLESWSSYNKNVELDCKTWRAKIETRPKVVKE
jgi:hypothetical protein